jgi:hypothetical protein
MRYDQTNRSRRPLLIILFALLGLVFCALRVSGVDLPCATSGCRIYAGYTLLGIPVYLYGAAGFGLILLLALAAGHRTLMRGMLFLVLVAGLLLDALFLGWQVLYWPCLSCLIVALLFALTALGGLAAFPSFRRGSFYTALILWLIAFVPVAINAAKEIYLQPWAIYGPADAPVRIFFSPTCPACAAAAEKILDDPALAERTRFIPVAKNDEDARRLARLMANGSPALQDLRGLFHGDGEAGPLPDRQLRLSLARNKMALARLGIDSIPLILSDEVVQSSSSFGLPGGINPLDLLGPGDGKQRCSAFETPGEKCD